MNLDGVYSSNKEYDKAKECKREALTIYNQSKSYDSDLPKKLKENLILAEIQSNSDMHSGAQPFSSSTSSLLTLLFLKSIHHVWVAVQLNRLQTPHLTISLLSFINNVTTSRKNRFHSIFCILYILYANYNTLVASLSMPLQSLRCIKLYKKNCNYLSLLGDQVFV